jgi:predicted DNA-binding protein (MmcQ/YjbR family)
MDIDSIREYCLSRKGAIKEDMPFGDDVLVFRVDSKIFMLMRLAERPLAINLKCDPEQAIELRERYTSVIPGYHMNKKYWNTVILDGKVPNKEVLAMIDHSYEEVLKGAPKKKAIKMKPKGKNNRRAKHSNS